MKLPITDGVKVPLFMVGIQYQLPTLAYDSRNIIEIQKNKIDKKYFHSIFPTRSGNFICTSLMQWDVVVNEMIL